MTSGILPGQKWRQGIPMFKIIKNADAAYDFEKTFIKFERMKYTRCGFTSANQKTGSLWTDTNYIDNISSQFQLRFGKKV